MPENLIFKHNCIGMIQRLSLSACSTYG